jgi:hypothetical protein
MKTNHTGHSPKKWLIAIFSLASSMLSYGADPVQQPYLNST